MNYYDPDSGRVRQYYPVFLAKMEDDSYQLVEIKGDNMIDNALVKAKKAAAEEMATASGIEYIMYLGSVVVNSHILDDSKAISFYDEEELQEYKLGRVATDTDDDYKGISGEYDKSIMLSGGDNE